MRFFLHNVLWAHRQLHEADGITPITWQGAISWAWSYRVYSQPLKG